MQQIYRRTNVWKCDFNRVVLQHNQHLPICIQQEIQERKVKLASSKQKDKKS